MTTFDRLTSRQADRRRIFAALVALACLNLADIVLTRLVLAHTGVAAEGNPLARLLLTDYRVELVKAAILCGLGYRIVRSRSTSQNLLCACWAAVGYYVMTVAVNAMVLASL